MTESSAMSATDEAYAKALLCFLDADREARPAFSLCDVTLIAGERKFRAHRTVLAAGSVYFRRLFSACVPPHGEEERPPLAGGGVTGSSSAVYNVEIAGVEPSTFELVLSFLYTASVRVDPARARSVRALGRALGVPFLAALPSEPPAPHAGSRSDPDAGRVPSNDGHLGGEAAAPQGEEQEEEGGEGCTSGTAGEAQADDGKHSDDDDIHAIVGVVSPVDNGLAAAQSVCHLLAHVEDTGCEGEEASVEDVRFDEPGRIEATAKDEGAAGGDLSQQGLNADFSEVTEVSVESSEQGVGVPLDEHVSISITAVCGEGKRRDIHPGADPGKTVKNGTECQQNLPPLDAAASPAARRGTPPEATIAKQGVEKHDGTDSAAPVQAKLHQGVGTGFERSPQGSSPAKAAADTGIPKVGRAAPGAGVKRVVSAKRVGSVAEDGSPVVMKSLRRNVTLDRLADGGSAVADNDRCDGNPKWSLEKLRLRSPLNTTRIWCGECGQAFRTLPALKRHRDVYHNPNRPYPCTVCGKRFLTSYKAWTHRRTQHPDSLGGGVLEEAVEDGASRLFLVIPPFVSGMLDGHTEQVEPDGGDGGRGGEAEEVDSSLGTGVPAEATAANGSAGGSPGCAVQSDGRSADGEQMDITAKESSDSERPLQTDPTEVTPAAEYAENPTENVETTAEAQAEIEAVTQEHVLEMTSEVEEFPGGAGGSGGGAAQEEEMSTEDRNQALEEDRVGEASNANGGEQSLLGSGEGDGTHIDDSGDVNGYDKTSADVEEASAEVDNLASIPEEMKSKVRTSPDGSNDQKSGDANKESPDQESITAIDSETQTDAVLEESQKKVPRKRKNISWSDEAAGGKLEQRLLVKKINQFGDDSEQSFTEEDDDDNEKEEPSAEWEESAPSTQAGHSIKTADKASGYVCGECGKIFPFYCRFREHAKTHMLDRPYGCSVCPKSFRREGNLRMHQRRHRLELLADLGTSPTSPDAALAPPRARAHTARRGARAADRAARDGRAAALAPRPKPMDDDSAAGEHGDGDLVSCRLCDLVLWSADERKEHELVCGQQRLMCRACGRTFRTAFSLWRHRLEVHHDSETFAFLSEGPAAESSSPEVAAAAVAAAAATATAAAAEPEQEESAATAAKVTSGAEKSEQMDAPPSPMPAVYLASASAAVPSAYSLLSLSDAAAAGSLHSDIPSETDSDKEAKAVSEILIVLGPALKEIPKTDEMICAEEGKEECHGDDTHFVTVGLNANEGERDGGDDHNHQFEESQPEGAMADSAIPKSCESPTVEGGAEIAEDKTQPESATLRRLASGECAAEEQEAAAAAAVATRVSCPKPRLIQFHPVPPARPRRDGAAKGRQSRARLAKADRKGAALAAAGATVGAKPSSAPAQETDFPHTCNKCGVVFSLFQQLERHQELFCEVKAFQCPDCNKSFRTNFRLWSHRQSFHWDGDAPPDSQSG